MRKALQDALLQSFGLTFANTYVDILWLSESGAEVVVRINTRCVFIYPYMLQIVDTVPFVCTVRRQNLWPR